MKEIDPIAFDEALKMSDADKKKYNIEQDVEDRKVMDAKWSEFDKKLNKTNPDYCPPNIPFRSDAMICNFNDLYDKIYDKEKLNQA